MDPRPNTYSHTVQGMQHKLRMIKLIAKNVANASTIGYQREIPESLSFRAILEEASMRDGSQGQLKKTGNMFDLAIEGNAFFLVESKDGPVPTRNGRLRLNKKGELVTEDEKQIIVLEKTDAPINIATSYDIKINHNGEIFLGTQRYGRIAMQVMDNKPVRVHQGYIEGSNVNLANEMMALTMLFRSFEASEKVLGMEASVDRDLIDKYGRNV